MFDYLIVGAGFAGSVLAERLATQANKKILLIDRRSHLGGNAYDHYDEYGILVHKYGPHIFHTNSQEVFDYLSQFTQWRPYEHRVLSSVDGQLLPFPINLNTINQLYRLNLTAGEIDAFLALRAVPRMPIRSAEDVIVGRVGFDLYEKFFKYYTRKQWQRDASELEPAVTARIPVRNTADDRYFNDTYQAMPLDGYTQLFEKMLAHPCIEIKLNTDFRAIKDSLPYHHIIYTGPIDEFFEHCLGKLPYRSLEFVFQTLNIPVYQPAAVVNYPDERAYTRITEFKYLTGQVHPQTSIVYEFPRTQGDPYYPVRSPEAVALAKEYKALADALPHVHFVGRLGTYQYYNIDQVVAQALSMFKKIMHTSTNAQSGTERSGSEQYMYVN